MNFFENFHILSYLGISTFQDQLHSHSEFHDQFQSQKKEFDHPERSILFISFICNILINP